MTRRLERRGAAFYVGCIAVLLLILPVLHAWARFAG
jgi:hypothetical protein